MLKCLDFSYNNLCNNAAISLSKLLPKSNILELRV